MAGNPSLEMTTDGMHNGSWQNATEPTSGGEDYAKSIFLTTQYIMTIIGAVANLATLLVLGRAESAFSPVYLFLLKSQAVMDFFICVCGTALVLQEPMWNSGNLAFDTMICHIWHGQYIYWTTVLASIWNLIIIAYERYLAICKPFSHNDFTMGRAYRLTVGILISAVFVNGGGPFQISMDSGRCVSEYYIPGEAGTWFFYIFAFWAFVAYYSGPTTILCYLYGRVAYTLIKRRDDSSLGESQLVNRAAQQMAQTAMTVTCIFIISMSWDFWYYLLGRLGIVIYIKNSLLQLVGIWLSSFNSFANPFVYMILLPAFRRSAIGLFCPCFKKTVGGESSTDGGPSKNP